MITRAGFDQQLTNRFIEALKGTYHQTIDTFLEKKTTFRDLGAFLIATTLLPLERPRQILPQRDWYAHLYQLLQFEEQHPDASHLTIVSLNYERSLEHFLSCNIDFNCYDKHLEEAHAKRKKLRVLHPHGSFGPYPDVPYNPGGTHPDILKAAATRIRIISDKLDESPDFQQAQEAIAAAEVVISMGFGYDRRTLDLLFKNGAAEGKTLLGTAFRLDDERRAEAVDFFNNKILLGTPKMTAEELIKAVYLSK